jgi:hypothetical protein
MLGMGCSADVSGVGKWCVCRGLCKPLLTGSRCRGPPGWAQPPWLVPPGSSACAAGPGSRRGPAAAAASWGSPGAPPGPGAAGRQASGGCPALLLQEVLLLGPHHRHRFQGCVAAAGVVLVRCGPGCPPSGCHWPAAAAAVGAGRAPAVAPLTPPQLGVLCSRADHTQHRVVEQVQCHSRGPQCSC